MTPRPVIPAIGLASARIAGSNPTRQEDLDAVRATKPMSGGTGENGCGSTRYSKYSG